jgi:heme/copper-type cytochrome/quinol oxidase subunit 1
MTTIDPHVAGAGGDAVAAERADGVLASVADWITSTDHKKIGRLFIGASLVVLLGVVAVATVLGAERIDAGSDFIDAGALPQLFAVYRVVLTFGVIVPFGLGLAIAVVPLQLGARSLAFPRLAASGFWAWLVGAGLVVGSIIANGGPAGGDSKMVQLFLTAHILLLVGLVAAAVSVTTSVLTTRTPGMNMRRVPLFAWSALVYGFGLVLALPVLAGVLVLLAVDHQYSRLTFGGNQGIGEWTGFAFTQPATVLYAVPVFGILLDTVGTATRRRLAMRGAGLVGLGLVATAFLAGVAQVDAALPRNVLDQSLGNFLQDTVPYALLHLLPLLGAVVVLGVFGAQLASKPKVNAALVFALFGALLVTLGTAAGALAGIGDAQLSGTVFEEGAWLAISYGLVIGVLGGIVHWGPKLWGRLIGLKQALPIAALAALGGALASVPYLIAGFADQPGGATQFDYSGPQDLWNVLSTVGHGLVLLAVLAFIGLAVRSFTAGPLAGDDPWDGVTLEWATTSPAPDDNFAELHVIASSEPLLDLKPARTEGAA